jgi:hypothetical protein
MHITLLQYKIQIKTIFKTKIKIFASFHIPNNYLNVRKHYEIFHRFSYNGPYRTSGNRKKHCVHCNLKKINHKNLLRSAAWMVPVFHININFFLMKILWFFRNKFEKRKKNNFYVAMWNIKKLTKCCDINFVGEFHDINCFSTASLRWTI